MTPVGASFDELMNSLRRGWLRDNGFTTVARDIAIALTLDDEGNRVNFNVGPIRRHELITWGLQDDVPDWFREPVLLVDVDHIRAGVLRYGPLVRLDTVREAVTYGWQLAADAEEIALGKGATT